MAKLETAAVAGRRAVLRACAGGAAALALVGTAWRAANAADGTVTIDNFTFAPPVLTVAPGTTVVWVNHDDIPHSIFCAQLGLRSHPMDTNETFSHRFEQPGTFDYVCGIHPFMRGRVVVRG